MIREPVVKLAGVMARVMGDLEAARADVGRAGVELDMALESPARNPLRQQIVELDQALDAAWRLADALAASLHLSQEEHDAVDAAMAADDFDDEVPIVIAAISAADEGRIR